MYLDISNYILLDGIGQSNEAIAVGDRCKFSVRGLGDDAHPYRLTLFCNFEPYVFPDGSICADFPVRPGKETSVGVDLDLSTLDKGSAAVVFALAIPTDDTSVDRPNREFQSECYLLVKK
ncbi:MAG: hypothetical protein FWF71_01535 [Actinomycetia bacterium]|nr:hypothetical protein [Actinomycetes bacterium]